MSAPHPTHGDGYEPVTAILTTPRTNLRAMPSEQQVEAYFKKVVFDDGTRPLLPPRWRIRDTVEEGGLVFIGGQSAAGKSFVVMELSRCLATGEDFFGRKIEQTCGVVLFAPEGQATIDARLAAMKRHHRIAHDLPFAYLGELPNIETPEGRAVAVGLLNRIKDTFRERFNVALGVVFMDTLAATMQLKDQNDSSEAAARIAQLREIQRGVDPTLTLVPVHHYGKNAEVGLTGGHGWKAGADQVLSVVVNDRNEVTGSAGLRELAIAKNRNGPEGPLAPFSLEYIGLGYRDDGTEWGCLYLVPLLDHPPTYGTRRERRQPKHVQTFEDCVFDALVELGEAFHVARGQGPTVRAVRLSPTVRELFFIRYPTGSDDEVKGYEAKRKAFQRATQQMRPIFATESVAGVEWIWSATGTSGTGGTN